MFTNDKTAVRERQPVQSSLPPCRRQTDAITAAHRIAAVGILITLARVGILDEISRTSYVSTRSVRNASEQHAGTDSAFDDC